MTPARAAARRLERAPAPHDDDQLSGGLQDSVVDARATVHDRVIGTAGQTTGAPAAAESMESIGRDWTDTGSSDAGSIVVTIEPSRNPRAPSMRELWAHRELLYYLAIRDLKVRYKQTILGVAWTVTLPLITALVFTVFIGRVARVQSGSLPYTLFAYAGLLPWTFFSAAVSGSANSLVGSAHLITKVYFPRSIVPAASIAARLVDFAISFVVLAAMMAWYHVAPTRNLLMLPVLVVLVTATSLAFGLWVAGTNVRFRDVGVIVPVALQLMMFVSPVMYPMELVPERWRTLYYLNPMAGIIAAFRTSVAGGAFDWAALAYAAAITVGLLVYAVRVFARTERAFADLV